MLPMMVRSFGAGAQEARAKGYSEGQQVLLGLTGAATEYLSERLFEGNPVYDSDVGLVNRLVGKIVKNPTVMEVLTSTPVETLNEGLEEIVSDLLDPVAEWAVTENRPEYELDQIIEDGATEMLTALMANGGARVVNAVAGGRKATAGAEVAQAQKTASGEAAEGIRVGKATVIQHPYDGVTPTFIGKRTGRSFEIQKENVITAQTRIEQAEKQGQKTGKSFRNFLTSIYEIVFAENGGVHGVAVDGLIMDGKPYVVTVNKSAVGKIISDANVSAEKLAVIDVIDDVVEKGEYVGSGRYIQKGEKRKHTIRFDYFETPIRIGNQSFIVAFDVEVFPSTNNYRTHRVINEMDLIPQGRTDTGTDQPQGPIGTDPSVRTTLPQTNGDVKGRSIPSDDPLVREIWRLFGKDRTTGEGED